MSDPNTQKALYSSQGIVAKTEAIFHDDASGQSGLLGLGYIDLQNFPEPNTGTWYSNYTEWTVPAGVTSISICGTGRSGNYNRQSGQGGAGSAFTYKNNISVNGGDVLYVFGGYRNPSTNTTSPAAYGDSNNYGYEQGSSQSHWGRVTNSWVYNNTASSTLWVCQGGSTGSDGGNWTAMSTHFAGGAADGGGDGGSGGPNRTGGPWFNPGCQGGGGGCGGYSGTGGDGGHYGIGSSSPHNAFGPYTSWGNGTAGTGGAGGGASGKNYSPGGNPGGGMTYAWGAGDAGAATTAGGQSGNPGSQTGTGAPNDPTWGAGGGGGGTSSGYYWQGGGTSNRSIIRIVWPGTTRQFPSTNVGWPL